MCVSHALGQPKYVRKTLQPEVSREWIVSFGTFDRWCALCIPLAKRSRGILVSGVLLVLLVWAGAAAGSVSPARWHVVGARQVRDCEDVDVARVPETRIVWAVQDCGDFVEGNGFARTWRRDEDGSWHLVRVPGTSGGELDSIAVLSADDAWVVGRDGHARALAMHWDGTAWSRTPTPTPGPAPSPYGWLASVAAISPTNVWAVGRRGADPGRTLTEHWDGTTWTAVPTPNAGPAANELHAVTAVPGHPRKLWAAGVCVGRNGVSRVLILRWRRTRWRINARLAAGGGAWGVDSNGRPGGTWVVGARFSPEARALTFRHVRGAWRHVPTPIGKDTEAQLKAVAGVPGTRRFWAVGSLQSSGYPTIALAIRWDGRRWKRVNLASRLPDSTKIAGSELLSILPLPGHKGWAVGYRARPTFAELVEHYHP